MKILTVFLLLMISFTVFSSEEIPKDLVKFSVQTLKKDGKHFLALSFKNHYKWHTYWKNPGDAGLPLSFKIKSEGKEIQLPELEWPTPKKFIEAGNMLAFGYVDDYSFFFQIPKNQYTKMLGKEIEVEAKWLVCKHICIPGKKTIKGILKDESFSSLENSFLLTNSQLTQKLSTLPQIKSLADLNIKLNITKDGKGLELNYEYNISNLPADSNLIFPLPQQPFDYKREQLSYNAKEKKVLGSYPISWDGEYMVPELPFPKVGIQKSPYRLRFIFVHPITKEASIIEKTFSIIGKKKNNINKEAASGAASTSLLFYILWAFIGGLILNVMPCVLPIISLKLFSLIKHKNLTRSALLKHNLSYSLGVISCFIAIGLITILLKNSGENVGWGFQLQSPYFVAAMTIFLFVFALNLFGVFEFKTPGGNKLGQVQVGDGFIGDFVNGVLATILSTPCSAPFLGTALTFAFSQSGPMILVIFTSVGVGLAFPFLLTAVFPKTISFLPSPGNWMETLKKFLGLSLLLTCLWLLDVFNAQVDNSIWALYLQTSLALIFFGLYIKKFLGNKGSVIFLLMAAVLSFILFSSPLQDGDKNELAWIKWSPEKMNELKGEKKLVFIDFTAKWCFTCKINEKIVLQSKAFEDLVKEKNLTLLLADWTKRDEVILNWLQSQGLSGVPAYFIQKENGDIINLGETITIKKIKKNL